MLTQLQQEKIALTRSKTAPIHDCRKVNEPSSRSTAQQYPLSKQPRSPTSIEHMPGELCQDTQGTLSPLERFVRLSLANDPSPWETKKALKKSGFQDDHTQDLELKLNAAAIAAVGVFTQGVGELSVVAVAGSI
jgi:hypothetical protein